MVQLRRMVVSDGEEVEITLHPAQGAAKGVQHPPPAIIVETVMGEVWLWENGKMWVRGLEKNAMLTVNHILHRLGIDNDDLIRR